MLNLYKKIQNASFNYCNYPCCIFGNNKTIASATVNRPGYKPDDKYNSLDHILGKGDRIVITILRTSVKGIFQNDQPTCDGMMIQQYNF